MSLLTACGLGHSYPRREQEDLEVLRDISLDLNQGDILTLLGPSGCGKSTLLRLISGFLPVQKGRVTLDGKPLTRPFLSGQMIFQENGQLLPWLSVEDNILFPLCRSPFPGLKPKPHPALREKAEGILDAVGLSSFRKDHPESLSGGMKQRCALGRALMADPEILFMDEPFGALDSPSRREMEALLLSLWKIKNFSIVFVTHDISEAVSLSGRILLFRKLTETPVEIPVSLERPRERSSREFKELEWQLYSSVEEAGRTL